MLTSWSEVSTPAELSIASVLRRTPASAASMRPRWVKPRLPPSPTTLQRSSRPSMRSASLARSPTSAWVSRAGLDVGADAAVVEQVDRRLQDRAQQLGRRQALGLDAERGARLRRDRDRFLRARPDAAAVGDQLRVVVGPRRARQLEQALALGERRGRVGVRVDEDVPVVERGDQPDVPRQQHAVAEHVARHVADADHGEVGVLWVSMPMLAEEALHALPGAARGDAHGLVVVADAAAGGEGVAEPVAVLLADRRWRSRRRSPCPCRRRPRGRGRRRRCARTCGGGTIVRAGEVVGEVEQAAQVVLVAGDAFLQVGVAVATAAAPSSARSRPSSPPAR